MPLASHLRVNPRNLNPLQKQGNQMSCRNSELRHDILDCDFLVLTSVMACQRTFVRNYDDRLVLRIHS